MVRDISSSKASLCVMISNPSCITLLSTQTCSDSLPFLPLQTQHSALQPTSPPWYKTNSFQISLAFSKQTKMLIDSLTLKKKGINSGTRSGSTVPHARSRRKGEILLKNEKSQNKNRKENNFQMFPGVNCSDILKKHPAAKISRNKTPGRLQ